MSNKLKSVKVGALSLLTIFLLYFGINFLKGINVMNNGRVFYAYYDNVSGLTASTTYTFYVKAKDAIQQNEEFGFIKFGSRVDIFFPIGTKIDVKIGEKVQGGVTVLARIQK